MWRLFFTVLISLSLSSCGFMNGKISGTVKEYSSEKLINQAQVQASYIGWGWRDGNLVWDKEYVYETTTNSEGKFSINMPIVPSVFLRVLKEGYSTNETWQGFEQKILIKLQTNHGSIPNLQSDILEIGFDKGIPYGWNFALRERTTDITKADLWPVSGQNLNQITISTLDKGGIASVSSNELGVTQNLLQYTDTAPQQGYLNNILLNLENNSVEPKVYFVRTRDGQHYAKFEFDPSNVGTIGSQKDNEQGTGGILLRYVYNPEPSHDLTFRK